MRALYAVIATGLITLAAPAAIKPAGIFTDGTVLQQGEPIRIWGTADAGEKVTVEFAEQRVSATADTDGKWMVTLEPMQVSSQGRQMKFYSSGNLQSEIGNVLVGEVWLAGGQSNMVGTMQNYRKSYQSIIDNADDDLLRFMTIPRLEFEGQNDELPEWKSTTPEDIQGFSATAYFFAKNLREKLDVPVGIVSCSVGATPAEAWMSRETLSSTPDLKQTLDAYDAHVKENFTDLEAYAELAAERAREFKKWFQSRKMAHGMENPGLRCLWGLTITSVRPVCTKPC